MSRSVEEDLIRRYFDAFNRHDVDGVMSCFHDEPVLIDMEGVRHEGRAAIRRRYEYEFSSVPDGRCEMRTVLGQGGAGMAESLFTGTHARSGRSIMAIGAEVIEFADGRFKTIRDYHRLTDSRDEP